MKFLVCSDTHIESDEDEKLCRIKNTIEYAYSIADNLDAVMFCGDLTARGKPSQYEAFEKAVRNSLRSNTRLLAIVAKNHDSWDKEGKRSLARCAKITGLHSDFHIDIDGIHLIGISTSRYRKQRYGIYQYIWLKKELKNVSLKSGDKPFFVFQHEHVRNTVYGSSDFDGWGINHFKNLYLKYPNLIHFSGHSHYPLNDPRSIWKKEFTAVGTGAMSYTEFTVDNERKLHPEGNGISAQAWIVEVCDDNSVKLTGIDGITGSILCQSILDSTCNEIGYNPPVFDEDSIIQYEDKGQTVTFVCPNAVGTENNPVFLYRAECNGEKKYIINNYWNNLENAEVRFEFEKKDSMVFTLTAENCYGNASVSLKYTYMKEGIN